VPIIVNSNAQKLDSIETYLSRTENFSALATPMAKRHFCALPVLQKSHGLPRERYGASREIPTETDLADYIGYDLQGLFGIKQTAYKA
jgi:hypothetical protein